MADNTAGRVLEIARAQVGAQSGAPYVSYYNQVTGAGLPLNAYWCACFVTYCMRQAGVPESSVQSYAGCITGRSWFENQGRFRTRQSGYVPSPGDVIFYDWNPEGGDGDDHTGIVESASENEVHTIEGNTGNGVCARRSYPLGSYCITGYGIPVYNPRGGSGTTEPEKKEITKVTVKSAEGTAGIRASDELSGTKTRSDGVELLIQHGKTIQAPPLEGDVTLEWKRKGAPGSLKFNCLKSEGLNFQEGDPVSLRVGGKDVFYGYVFEKFRKDPVKISVLCYDQLRYFKNKDTLVYANKKYSDLVKMLAKDYGLKTGTIEDTGYVIKNRIEEATLFDMCANASDLTVTDTGKLFVLYDDFGKLCLRNIENMKLDRLIDQDTAQEYNYKSSIDKDAYSRIRLALDNDETGERELYDTNSEKLQKQWGILQLYEKYTDASPALLKERGKMMLDYYGKKRRTLSVKKCLGDIRVRGGSSLVVLLELGDINLSNWMVVEAVKHTFSHGEHWMDLDVIGWRGEFVA